MNRSEVRLFVGNIPVNTSKEELACVFSSFGEIVHLDLKSKTEEENKKCFAFVTLSASNYDIESCIKHFSDEVFKGTKLYVTRARESFLERLQREREQQKKEAQQNEKQELPKKNPVIKLGEKLNPRKRRTDTNLHEAPEHKHKKPERLRESPPGDRHKWTGEKTSKKDDSEKKRIESLKQKRLEFKEKQLIIKSGLCGVDKVQNKKVIFSDNEADVSPKSTPSKCKSILHRSSDSPKQKTLFEDNDSDDDINFNIKKHFEGKAGQKVLDLQSRYKSDKRFVLDERFVDDEAQNEEEGESGENEQIDLEQADEKARQLNILQDVLGVAVRPSIKDDANKKTKAKLGMLRFDPLQPEHAKFLAPAEESNEQTKKSKKKKKDKEKQEEEQTEPKVDAPKVEVSKEQFYNVSETLKEAITQPTSFSLRSLFGNNDEENKETETPAVEDYKTLPIKTEKKKVKNPLDLGETNPFRYDSSDTEDEQDTPQEVSHEKPAVEATAVWKENLFFTEADQRLKEGLAFFNKSNDNEGHKERRELKSLMKKRIYNKERKNQMFKKKIGGRRKTMKKSYKQKT